MSDVRMSVILTVEQMNEEGAEARGLEEHLVIVEQFKDRLEKFGETQRDGINITKQEVQRFDAKKDKWGSLCETEADMRNSLVEEPVIQEICIERRTSSRSATEARDMTDMVSHLSMDIEEYFEQSPVMMSGSQEDLVQDRFEQVVVKRDGKRRPPDIKKPIRKKLRDRERSRCSSSEGELERMSSEESLDGDVVLKESGLVPTTVIDPPASPLVVETPIGSIKDRVKALQNKVEEDEVQKNNQVLIHEAKSSITTKMTDKDMPELPKVPKSPESPRSQTERLEETMSVKELMKAFQTGQDPSKSKFGLFEHKAMDSSSISTFQHPTQEPKSQIQTQSLTIVHQQSDFKECDKTDFEDEAASLMKDNSEESQLISDGAYFKKTVEFVDTVQRDDGKVSPRRETPEKETLSVKKLMKTFQTGQDSSENKAEILEPISVASACISTLISESADSEEIQKPEQNLPQEPESQIQTQSLTIFHQQSDVKECDRTNFEDKPAGLIKVNSEESQLISDGAYFKKTVKFVDTFQHDNGKVSPQRETPEKETMSVKELMKTFQTGQDSSETKAEILEPKSLADSSISTSISESADAEEIQKPEQSHPQEPESQIQTQSLTIFHQQSDVKECDTTDFEDKPAGLIKDDSEESQLISDGAYFKKTVKFVDTFQRDDGKVSPQRETPEKETMSVKELMKTFQTGQDSSETKAEILEPKSVADSSISTSISESADAEEIQKPEQSHPQEPESQIQTQSLTIFHQQSDVKECDRTNFEDKPAGLIKDNSEESQLISDGAYFKKTVKFVDMFQRDDGKVSPQRETPEKETMSVKELMKTFQTGQDSSENKAEILEPKSAADSSISTLMSESADSEEIQKPEQSHPQGPESQIQTQSLTIFHQQSDVKECDKTDSEDQSEGFIKDNSEESQLISDGAYFKKTVKFVDTVQCDDGRISPQRETPEKETMSVKKLMKTFQTVQDSSETKAEILEPKSLADSSISTLISESADSEEIQKPEQSHPQEPESQIQTQSLTIFHQQSDVKECDKTDSEDQSGGFIKDNSEESHLISDGAYFKKTVKLDGKVSPQKETPEKEIMSVKELMKTFQTGQDPSNTKAVLFGPKAASTLIFESKDSEERQIPESSPTEEPKSQIQTRSLTIFHEQSDLKKCDKTDLEDEPLSLIKANSEETQFMSDSVYLEKTVKFVDTVHYDDGKLSPQRETVFVKELMKTFQTGQDSSETKAELLEPESVASSSSSTLISESAEIQTPERSPTQEPESQIQTQSLTIFHQQSDVNIYVKTDLDQPVSLISDNSEESHLISDGDHFGVRTDTIQFDDGSVSPQNEEQAFSGNGLYTMQLKEPLISTGRSLSEDIQISPDRRPSEDFSADIKAELEESPEYQLFKQTSTAADVSYQLEPPERETLGDDSDMNLASFSSPRIQSYFGKGFSLMENQMRDDDLSPESSKHEGLTDSSDTSVAIRTPHSSSGDSENYEGLTLTRQMTNETLTYSAKRGEKYTIPSQEEKIHESWKDNTTITHGGKTSLTQTDTEVLDVKNEESQLKEVHTEKKTSRQESKTVKDMSGMLSLLSSDLDQYVQDRPVVSQPPEEDIVQEKFEQVILIKDKDKETLTVVTHENKGAIMDGTTKPIDHVTMAEHSITRGAEELKDEHKASNQVKDSSEMFSVINSDLDEYQEPRPVADRPIEEDNVQEKFEILPSFTDENKGVTLDNTAEETDCAGFKHTVTRGGEEVVCELKVTHSNLTEELPMKEEWVEKKTSYQRSTKVKEMSGMMSLLNSDLDQYLKDRPVKTRSPEEDVIQEKFDEVVCELKETHSNLTEELPMKEEWVEKKTSYQRSTKVKEMSGMMSLLNSDLDQYLKDRPVKTRSPEEDVIQEKFDEVILTKVRKSSSEEQTITVCEKTQIVAGINVEDEIGGETYEQMQTDVVEVQELTPSSVLETPFQEVCIQKRTHQQCSTEKDMSGMLSLLSSNLDQYLKERPVTIQCHPEEDLVHESYKQVILTTKISPEHNMMSPEDTNVDIVDINEKEVLESEWQACYHEDEGPKSFLSEEGEAKLSRLSSAGSHFNDSTEGMVDLTKSYAISEDWNNDHKDVSVVPAHSVLETYTFSQLPSSFNTPRRPTDLENLNTVVFDDPAKEPCHQDSLEASPLMEDRSSKKSPDSIEPSPIGESPCPDSLEGSPTKSKDSEPQMPTKTAVYEDYASQLKACFAYDKDVYRDESEQHEQENTGENIQRESEIEEDKYSNSAMAVTDGNMSSDPKICDSENLHMLIRQDSLDTDESGDDIIHKQFTPEEEMFKMAAKIKTFEVMEQEAKMKRDASLETGDHKDDELNLTFGPVTHSSSQDTLDEISEQCVTQDTHTLIETTDITLSITEQVEIQSQLKTTGSTDSSLCLTATQREEPDPGSEEPVPLLAEREVQIHKDEDAIEGDQASLSDTHFSAGVTDEHHPEEDEVKLPPRDDSDFVSRPPTMVCAKELEYVFPGCEGDDVAFDAQVEAEKQINLFPAEDIQTPHKTPVRIPGDETSPDPFQFQEGKLFEMTRGGAIDMTRRSFDEEEEGYALPHMGEHPVDEVVPEETGEGQSVRISVTLDNSDSITDTTLQEIPKSSLTQGASDEIPTPKPRTLMTPSSKKSESEKPLSETDLGSSIEVHLGSPNALERLTNVQGEVGTLESLGLGYLDSTIADLQSDTSTVGHAVYSEQSHDSPDSSNDDDDDEEEDEEDQCSVIEMCLPAAQGGIPAYHQDSPPPLAIKPSGTIKKTCHFKSEIILKDSPTFELDHVQRKAEKSSALDRRTRSEADSDTSKASKKDRRSYSDSSQSTHKSKFAPSKLPVMMQQKPLAHSISSSSPQKKEIHISKTTETSVRSSLDTDDISSASHRSPDSVIFKYEIPASHSSDSDGNPLPGVQPSSRKEDVFETRPTWDDMVETQMQRITDDHTPKLDWQDDADRKEETLAIIADLLGFSWTELARELEFSEDDIQLLRTENPNSLQEQSHALLQRWVEREGKHATEDCLIKRLTKINRMDIVHLIETQMNKSVQEQTSRTYAEIEKTLDHSEVSVALSSVQEDADSPRVVRKVESDRRPPPAVSEEDLSVASLLDIPSWAEPVGHTHSESMHGDLLEELEIPHELNPNLWTSEDIITPEPTCYDNSDEQADEMPNLPTQSVTEEKYKDENGHIVVKRVTRKIIRKCVSADGVEREEVSLEGAPQGSVSMAEGDGYSKVVKRTVVKSEGDHTEVTFTESEGFSASRQETGEGCQVSRVERTTVVEGERTMTHHGDPSLASDLPSAQDDFKQALGYISGFRRAELPHVVERETVREDGTVVRRAHMHKGRTLRRTVAKGAGKRKQVLLERVDSPRKGSKPHDLQQHLHQLFHRFYEEDKEDNDDDEEEEEEE
ncbi:ankyrin-2 isoform X2 [Seriola aureovittata]|uniref:ankyrin-2 isoform X2 n=1 Tax=Seriola aureovittata TaxID=2871759 RepID=UPI0024BECE90|nr:ankyrin-2 isoform X2 [Seriola aureovittata]